VSNMDIPVTILDAAGLSFKEKVDGKSLLPLAENPDIEWRDSFLGETHGHLHLNKVSRMIVTEKHKYIWNKDDIEELYDLKEDPYEMNNLANNEEYKGTLEVMKRKFEELKELYNKLGFNI